MDAFDEQIGQVRASGVLGRSQALARLFDYLADPARRGRTLTEAEVAQDVFGRGVDLAGDASVRVYVHRLRRKLEQFYDGPGAGQSRRLTIPVGEYRLDLAPAAAAEAAAPRRRRPSWPWIAAAAAALLVILNGAAWVLVARDAAPARELARVAAAPLWAPVGRDRPVLLVVGDYYIFGETDGGREPRRMVREFDVNSPADLDVLLMERPELQGRYIDLDTYYAPVGATLALREILPLARRLAGGRERLRVVTASQLTPDMLKNADIVYVGYLSGLGLLREPVFARSRFEVGETFDELIDRRTGTAYVSGAGAAPGDRPNRDYGYLAAFEGAAGNRFVIVAGARDIGVMQTAEVAADPAVLADLPAPPLEVLYEVEGVGRTNLSARPVVTGR